MGPPFILTGRCSCLYKELIEEITGSRAIAPEVRLPLAPEPVRRRRSLSQITRWTLNVTVCILREREGVQYSTVQYRDGHVQTYELWDPRAPGS